MTITTTTKLLKKMTIIVHSRIEHTIQQDRPDCEISQLGVALWIFATRSPLPAIEHAGVCWSCSLSQTHHMPTARPPAANSITFTLYFTFLYAKKIPQRSQIKSNLLVLGAVKTTINDQGCQHVTGRFKSIRMPLNKSATNLRFPVKAFRQAIYNDDYNNHKIIEKNDNNCSF